MAVLNYYLNTWGSISLCVCHVHRTKIMECLSLGGTHFQGPALLGNLHSVDITRRIGSLICSSLTLNVIYTGRLVVWTFIVRETFLAKPFNQTTQKSILKGPYANNSKKRASHVAVGEAAYWWVLNKFTTMQSALFGSGNWESYWECGRFVRDVRTRIPSELCAFIALHIYWFVLLYHINHVIISYHYQ